jgi:DNA-binding transcriptional ArsR family regulator
MTLMTGEDRLSETFAALASSTRRAILARLAEGEANVNELAEPFDITLPAISKHIKVLRSVRDFARKEWPLRGSVADVLI